MDDKKKKGVQDDIRIDVHEEYELSYWTKKLGVSRDELRKAADEAGPLVRDIIKYLSK